MGKQDRGKAQGNPACDKKEHERDPGNNLRVQYGNVGNSP